MRVPQRHEETGTTGVATADCGAVAGRSHYWIIEAADGPTSKGACKICGEERSFTNQFVLFAIPPDDAPTKGRKPRHGPAPFRPRERDPLSQRQSGHRNSCDIHLAGMENRQLIQAVLHGDRWS